MTSTALTQKTRNVGMTLLTITISICLLFCLSTAQASAASKKPSRTSLTSVTSADYDAIKIKWKKVSSASKYQVYRSSSKKGKFKKIATTASLSYTNRNLKFEKKYYYKVRALKGSKKGTFSKVKYSSPKLKNVNPLKISGTASSVTLSWSKVRGASGYQIYRAYSKNGKYTKVKTVTSLKYTNTGLSSDKTYFYKIRAYRKVKKLNKYSAFSKIVSHSNSSDLKSIREDMLQQINKERKAAGVNPIALYEPINKTALEKAMDLYKTGVFSHKSENLGYFNDQLNRDGISYYSGGENIAYEQSSVNSVMKSWMNSQKHKENILGNDWNCVGIGYYKGYWVQQFLETPTEDIDDDDYSDVIPNGATVICDSCGAKNKVTRFELFSVDADGTHYGSFYCSNCNGFIEKCPDCETGVFEFAGYQNNESVAYACKNCGNERDRVACSACPYCGSKFTNYDEEVDYDVVFGKARIMV